MLQRKTNKYTSDKWYSPLIPHICNHHHLHHHQHQRSHHHQSSLPSPLPSPLPSLCNYTYIFEASVWEIKVILYVYICVVSSTNFLSSLLSCKILANEVTTPKSWPWVCNQSTRTCMQQRNIWQLVKGHI